LAPFQCRGGSDEHNSTPQLCTQLKIPKFTIPHPRSIFGMPEPATDGPSTVTAVQQQNRPSGLSSADAGSPVDLTPEKATAECSRPARAGRQVPVDTIQDTGTYHPTRNELENGDALLSPSSPTDGTCALQTPSPPAPPNTPATCWSATGAASLASDGGHFSPSRDQLAGNTSF
jgi:hypothetical protein